MKILGLDTSTDTGGVALLDGERLVAEYTLSLQRTTHSERLLPAVRHVLDDAGWSGPSAGDGPAPDVGAGAKAAPVQGIAVALGPGSFTGLRIAVVTAKALAFSWNVPVAGVSTLEALAYQARGGAAVVCPIMDARHGNVYSAVYDTTGPSPVALLAPGLRVAHDLFASLDEELAAAGFVDETVVFTGDGLGPYWSIVEETVGQRATRVAPTYEQLRCGAVAALGQRRLARGERDDLMQLTPLYLRKSEAERKWELHAKKLSRS